ncbi:LysM peptidoglycan-binding domain-containing protein [Agreia pratensis]|uniref:LysM domain-containing protein n=1 Tax=Agreia pratensis TaxID=150121 RepID=A0A1X7L7W1_9MICO|nr:LysM domain-containing protein [Agreia pratensis]SMG49493.1 LysM domain-containing protein [Agreia pratensis]
MTRSPSRASRRARHHQPRSFAALVALPFVLVGLVASKLAASSSRRKDKLPVSPDPTHDEPDESSYRVELGDTVSEIAIRHGLPTAHVLAQNGLSWKTPIFPGQLLRLDPIPDDLEWPAAETADRRDRRFG